MALMNAGRRLTDSRSDGFYKAKVHPDLMVLAQLSKKCRHLPGQKMDK
jgi:hypothetical protein